MNYQITDTPESDLDVLTRDTDGKVLVAVTKPQHTPRPLVIVYPDLTDDQLAGCPDIEIQTVDGAGIAQIDSAMTEISEPELSATAARLVQCYNNCAGINPEAVPEMLEALKAIEQGLIDGSIAFVKRRQSENDPFHKANILLTSALSKAEGRS